MWIGYIGLIRILLRSLYMDIKFDCPYAELLNRPTVYGMAAEDA